MKIWKLCLKLLVGCIMLGISGSGLAVPNGFMWDEHPLLARYNIDDLSGNIGKYAGDISGGTIRFNLDAKNSQNSYGLHYQGSDVVWYLNGNKLDNDSVSGDDGLYYRIPGILIKPGDNILEYRYLSDSPPQTIKLIELFPLIFTDEEVHFDWIFGAHRVRLQSQPAMDTNQLRFDVQHIVLNQKISLTSSVITASMAMVAQCIDSTLSFKTVVLDLDGNSGSFSVKSVDWGLGTQTTRFTHTLSQSRLFIPLPAALPLNSIFTVRVYYSGTPNPNGTFGAPYRASTHGTPAVPIIYSFSEPYGARQWWPCKDVPDDKFTADLYWTCATAYFPVSNGVLSDKTINSNGTHTLHYKESYPVSSYLVSVACTNYKFLFGIYTSLNGTSIMTVGNYIYPENLATEGNGVGGTLALIKFYARMFGEYPFIREKYVTASHNISSSMEHQTCTSLGGGLLSPDGRGRSNCHEFAHQWFGDMITMKNFDHLWLNEGFATYIEALWIEEQYGTDSYHTYVNNWTTYDTYPIVGGSADNFSGYIVYRKGAWVLHMLRKVMGDAPFFAGIKDYAGDTSLMYGNALSSDFQRHMESSLGGTTSLSWFFNAWLYQSNRPAYQIGWGNHTQNGNTVLDLRINQTQTGGYYVMPVDVKVKFTGGTSTTVTVWNTQTPLQYSHVTLNGNLSVSAIVFDPDNWLLKTASITPIKNWNSY